jgi:uridine phosphorylase
VASKGSGCINRNFDAFFEESKDSPYVCTRIAPANADLSALLSEKIGQNLGEDVVVEGCNVTADSFYSTQGRQDPHFDDQNEGVIAHIKNTYPEVRSMEMETFQLFHMAMCAKASHSIAAAAAAIVVAHRETGQVVDGDTLSRLESEGGRSIMQAITSLDL